jgi:hypothetical protein
MALNSNQPLSWQISSTPIPWSFISKVLHQEQGAPILLTNTPTEDRRERENTAMIEYNNHKKSRERLKLLLESVHKEIKKGWVLQLPLDTHKHLPNAMIYPIVIVEQVYYALDGSTSFKERLTQDQTSSILEGSQSVNKLTDLMQYPPMIYGFCFLHMVHQIISMRHPYPDKHIHLFMLDYKSVSIMMLMQLNAPLCIWMAVCICGYVLHLEVPATLQPGVLSVKFKRT